ncbi:hypothetical protein IV203_010113 [Nitzschia inconspicua]|uniref:Uncharacterized protein n=1 Tax=Nitzschia inconspicua TaxID=303405 RepID=A0A9K3KVK7_9STRA|nr:hypothetical protein IV203_011007 [Nitzschia inconspicua]KAG7350753.1 hypothetical protein IV203_010113 [Nitzschia inconspicua]
MSNHKRRLAQSPPKDGEDELMISPSCVIVEGKTAYVEMEQQQLRLKENPGLIASSLEISDIAQRDSGLSHASDSNENYEKAASRRLSFSPQISEYEPTIELDVEDMLAMWWTPADIKMFQRAARAKAQSFLRRYETFKQNFQAVFQECSKQMTIRELLETESVQRLLVSSTTLRGLESRTIGIIREYRNFHIQNVLDVASHQNVDAILRSSSLRTSKPSRNLARILAKQDYIAIAHMIRKELDGEPSSPSSSSKETDHSNHDAVASVFSASQKPYSNIHS